MLLYEASGCGNKEKESDDDGGTGSEDGSEDDIDEDEKKATNKYDTVVNSLSFNDVLGRLPTFLNTKSTLEEELEQNRNIILLSEKYHAECAGQGIEYCFGRCKWWFKKNNRGSTAALKVLSAKSFTYDVVSVDHCHKFSHKNRYYNRAYRGKSTGLNLEHSVKLCKTHPCALDTDFMFITE